MTVHRVAASLQGIRKHLWRKNLNDFFMVNGRYLTDDEVRKVVDYGISKGYETNKEFTDEEIINLLGWKNEKTGLCINRSGEAASGERLQGAVQGNLFDGV